jgi:hypothetical protein
MSYGLMATIEILMGGGLLYFWYTFFTTEQDLSDKPEGWYLHERSFVFPDVTIALLLFVSAGLLLAGNVLGERTSLVAGGMLLFLGIIDVAYHVQNGMLSGGAKNRSRVVLIDSVALGMALLLVLRFL